VEMYPHSAILLDDVHRDNLIFRPTDSSVNVCFDLRPADQLFRKDFRDFLKFDTFTIGSAGLYL
jgi:hypothetical protein